LQPELPDTSIPKYTDFFAFYHLRPETFPKKPARQRCTSALNIQDFPKIFLEECEIGAGRKASAKASR
jgi:hypothetical protein